MKKNHTGYGIIVIVLLVVMAVAAGCMQDRDGQAGQVQETSQVQPSVTSAEKTGMALPIMNWTKEPGIRIAEGVSPAVINIAGTYLMYYPGPGGLIASQSNDGLSFTPIGIMVRDDGPGSAQQMVSNPAIIVVKDGSYRMIYEGQDANRDRRLYSAVSPDGMRWTKEPDIRFADQGDEPGSGLFTSVPDSIRLDSGDLRMYYTRGLTSATAISKDDGLTWVKEGDLDLGRIALDPDIVRLGDGSYVLFFTSFDREFGVGDQFLMSARSKDGIWFTVDDGKRLEPSKPGLMIVDPDTILLPDGRYRMYYGEMGDPAIRSQILSAVSG